MIRIRLQDWLNAGPQVGLMLMRVGLLIVAIFGSLNCSLVLADELDDYNVAVGLYKQSRWKPAAEEFRKFIKLHEKHEKAPLARLYLGLTLVNLENYPAARDELRKFAEDNRQNSNIAQARYRIGECSYLLDDWASARVELEGFVQDFPKDSMCEHALPYLGDAQLRLKDPAAALKTFDRAIDAYPTGKLIDDAKFGRARALEALKRFDDATRQYEELAAKKEGARAVDAQFYLAAGQFERKRYPEALAAYSALVRDFPQSSLVPAAQLNIGFALYQSGKFAEAARQFELTAKEKSQAVVAQYWQGRSLKLLGEYAKAAEVLKEAEKSADKHSLAESIAFEQALCERYMLHSEAARRQFEQILSRFPQGDLADDSLHALIEMAIEAGNLTDAETLIARFKKDYPLSGLRLHLEMLTGRLELAQAANERREKHPVAQITALYEAAARRFVKVLDESSLPKTKSQARYYLALTRQLEDKPDEALELIAPLVEQATAEGSRSDFADAIVLQADCFYQQKKFDNAAAATGKYLELNPKGRQVARALSIQALAAENQKDATVMNAAISRLISEHATNPYALATLQQLAELAEVSQDWTGAERLYKSLAENQTDLEKKAYAIRGVALAQYWQGQYPTAAETFAQVVNDFPRHTLVPECLYFQAESLKKADRLDQSITVFQKLFDTYQPVEPPASGAELEPPLEFPFKAGLQVARLLNKVDKTTEANAAYEALFKRFPKPKELDQRLDEWAVLNYQHREYEQADAIWRRLIQETPESPLVSSAKLSLAESDLIANKVEAARTVFEELAENDKTPDEVKEQALYQLVALAVEQQRWPDAIATGSRLTSQFPNSSHRYYVAYTQAESLLAISKPTEADLLKAHQILQSLQAETANPAVSDAPWFGRIWVLLAELNFREKKYPEVAKTVEDLKQANPKSPFLYQAEEVLGRSLKQQAPPKFDEARAVFERVVNDTFAARTETAAKSQFMIGETYYLQEKWSAASLAYQRVYSLYKFPEWQASALLMSAKCDEKQDDWKLAVESYKLLVTEFPESSVASEAKSRLEVAQKKAGG